MVQSVHLKVFIKILEYIRGKIVLYVKANWKKIAYKYIFFNHSRVLSSELLISYMHESRSKILRGWIGIRYALTNVVDV